MNRYPIAVALLFLFFFFIISFRFSSRSNTQADLADDVSIDCGSARASAASNGRQWLGDVGPKLTSLLKLEGLSSASAAIRALSSADPVPHQTARISRSKFSYPIQVKPGEKIIRLHFNPTPYRGFQGLSDFFTVEAAPFTLLSNFNASLTADALGVNTFAKEFCFNVQENQLLTLTFSPETSPSQDTYAFINGIEIISVPETLSYFDGGDIGLGIVGQNSMVYVDDSTALEIVHRLHVGEDIIPPTGDFDGVFPKWATQRAGKVKSNTWKMPVEVGFRYLIRLHFKNGGSGGGAVFKILINEMIAHSNSEMVNGMYRDYVVVMRGQKQNVRREILISLQSYDVLEDGVGVLAGFEIVKLSNPDYSLASPNPLLPPQNLQSHTIWSSLFVLGYLNAIATIATTVLCLTSTVHQVRLIWEARRIHEDEHKPSNKAERHCRRFSLYEIQSATRNFSDGLVIGRGGFGKVYKGVIDKGQTTVAVKRLKSNSRQGVREFLTEIETLSELRHINLVTLIGYCSEHREMILVYEYMACGTLADHLYKLGRDNSNFPSLNWKQRLKICIGAARGLDYLHTGHRVIHRDVKASNILLDENFIAKVSDFGLAKTEDRSKVESHVSTKVKGTFGYLDPNYYNTQKLTRKSDTYAFGVVLLEALCGRPAVDSYALEDERILTRWTQDKISRGEIDQIIASSLRDEISVNSLKVFVEIADRCLHEEPKKRPTMSQVVVQLEFVLEQQESKVQSSVPNNIDPVVANDVYPFNEVNTSSENVELLEEVSTEVETFTSPTKKTNTSYSRSDKGDGKKPKTYIPLKFWTWGAFRNKIKPSKRKELMILISEISGSYIKLPRFDLTSIASATNQFSPSQKIGDSGRCSVYKAVLPTGQTVAVKRFSLSWLTLDEFKNEIFLSSRLNHRNIMNLLGYCIHENGEAILVYDYMARGTLYDHLHKSDSPLTWKQRLQICIDAAKGLDYLHTGSDDPIIHRDFKSANILLDKKWMAKLSHFSQSRAGPSGDSDTHVSTCVQGTLGYLDPEYFHTSQLTDKSDVYSYGVVLFEVLCRMPAINIGSEAERMSLPFWATLCFEEGKLEEITDCNLNGQIAPECFKIFAETAIACVKLHGVDRPAMRDIVRNMEFAMQLQMVKDNCS